MKNINNQISYVPPEKSKRTLGKIVVVLIVLCAIFTLGFVLQRGNRNTNQRTDVTTKNYTISTSSSTRDNTTQASYNWKYVDNNLKSKKYNLTFKLTTDEVQQCINYLEQVENMSDYELGCSNIKNKSSIEYYRAYWHAVYNKLYTFESPKFDKIVSGFKDIFSKENFSSKDKMLFLMTFVQNITYKRPGDYLDIIPGKVVISKRYGDCDTKSMLLYVLFEKFGIDCVMFWSYQYSHAMLGVNTSASGYSKTHNGKKYYFLETTYPDWAVGQISPEWSNTNYWYVMDLDSKTTTYTDNTQNQNTRRNTNTRETDTRKTNERQRLMEEYEKNRRKRYN